MIATINENKKAEYW